MRPNAVLAALLETPGALTRPRELRELAFRQVEACRSLRDMRLALDALEEPSTDDIFGAMAPHCQDVGWVRQLLAELVGSCADDFLYCSPLRGAHDALSNDNAASNLVLLEHRFAVVSLHSWVGTGRKGRSVEPPFVQVTGKAAMFRGLSDRKGSFQIWSCDPVQDDEDFSGKSCRFERNVDIDSTRMVRIDGRREALAVREIEQSFAALQIRDMRNTSPFVLEFATSDGRLVNVLPARVADSRVLMMMSALRRCGRTNERTLRPYLEHPNFAIRWQAMRELIASTGVRSRPVLEEFLAKERNPTVLKAGASTIELLQSLSI